MENVIEIKDLKKSYGKDEALKGPLVFSLDW